MLIAVVDGEDDGDGDGENDEEEDEEDEAEDDKDDEEDKTGLVFGDSIVELIILEFMINDLMP